MKHKSSAFRLDGITKVGLVSATARLMCESTDIHLSFGHLVANLSFSSLGLLPDFNKVLFLKFNLVKGNTFPLYASCVRIIFAPLACKSRENFGTDTSA